MGIHRAYVLVMLGGMVLGDIVAKVFGTWVPGDVNILVAGLIRDPEVAHFHGGGSLAFYSIIGYTDSGVVVTVNGGRWLGMAHFFEDESEDFDFLGIEEKGPEFGFGGRRRY